MNYTQRSGTTKKGNRCQTSAKWKHGRKHYCRVHHPTLKSFRETLSRLQRSLKDVTFTFIPNGS